MRPHQIGIRPAGRRLPACRRTGRPGCAPAHPDGEEVTPAALLVAAGEHPGGVGDHEGALGCFRRAVEAEGTAALDERSFLHHALLATGCAEEAREVAEQVRRSCPTSWDVYLFIGEDWEEVGDLDQANRWLTMGLPRLERVADLDDPTHEV